MSQTRCKELFLRYGSDTVSSQSLEPGLQSWLYQDDACVAYWDTGRAWVAVGAPIGPQTAIAPCMEAFVEAGNAQGKRVCFFATESQLPGFQSLAIGEQAEWDPNCWPQTLATKASLREQLRRARAKSVQIRELPAGELQDSHDTFQQICTMINDWQRNRAMAPMAFLVTLDVFGNPDIKRYFVAEYRGKVVAILVAVSIPARSGWFFEDVLRAHDAPNGTIELLFDQAMGCAAREGIQVVSYGLAPLSGSVGPWLSRIARSCTWLYDFSGLRDFKAKLLPHTWRPIYLSVPKSGHSASIFATIDSLTAFAGGSWWGFLWRTILHAQPTLVWALALLLLPWIALLVHAPTALWFPNGEIHTAWICLDILLFVALVHLAIHWRRNAAAVLAVLAATDALLGLLQFALFNRQQIHTTGQFALAVLAIAAPAAAAIILGLGAKYRERLYVLMR